MQTPTLPTPPADHRALVADLAQHLRRTAFLLNSARLVITDPVARDIAKDAVDGARAALVKSIGVAP